MQTGTIVSLKLDRGFGFIAVAGQQDVYFNASALRDGLAFDEQLQERRVEVDLGIQNGRERAIAVRPARKQAWQV